MKKKATEKTPLRVLCLEDTPQDAEIMRELLTDAGFVLDMDCTDKEKEFVSFLRTHTYDIILSDFKLPGFDGFKALQWVTEICPLVPFICVSGTIGEEKAVELLKQGAVDYVIKDRLTRLPAAIKRALDEAKEKEERKRVEKELRWKTAFLEAQVNSSIDGILVVDIHGKKILQNQRCIDLWKIPQNIIEQNDDAVQVQYVMNRTKYPEQFVEKVKHLYTHPHEISHDEIEFKDGMFLDRYSAPVLGQDGTNYGRIWRFRDITERKQADEALRRSETGYRSLFENSLMGISAATLDGRLVHANMAYAQMYGYNSPKEIIAEVNDVGYQLYAHPEDRKEVLRILAEKGEMEPREIEVIRRDGTRFFVLVSAKEIRDADGKILYYQANHIDITKRKKTEEELKKSEEKYRSIFENVQDVYYETLVSGTLLEVSPSIEIISKGQYKRADLIGRSMNDFYADINDRHTIISALQKTGSVTDFEVRLKNRDGSLIPCSISAKINFDEKGQPNKIIGSMHDVTDRNLAEEAMRESETRYRSVLQSATDAIVTADSSGSIIGWNSGAERIFGYGYTEAVGQSLTFIMPNHHRDGHTNGMKRVLPGGNQHVLGKTVELEGLRKDGSIFPLELSLSSWETTSGLFFTGIIRDITGRKQVEEALQESELRFRTLYENTTIGLYRATPDGKILLANPALVKMLGYTSFQQFAERNLEKDGFEPTYQRKEFLEKIERDGMVTGYETKWTLQGGMAIFVLESARAIRDAHGRTLYYDGTVEDITERKHAEEALRQIQKLEGLGTLAGGIAHDFNNILGIILAYVTSIKRFKDDAKKLDLATETIMKAVHRGKTLVQQILTFARKTETAFGAVDINDVVMEIMTMIFETFPKILTYAQNFDKTIPYVNADRSQVYQALLNLCVNGRDAMPGGGILTINTRMVSGTNLRDRHAHALVSSYVCIEVSDTGEGMTEEVKKRIFEPFFTTKGIGKGTGLGLAVVFGIVQTHKGFIEVESALGKGTTFRLYLPASQAVEPVSEKDDGTLEEIPGGTETLLVVEDEEMLMISLQMILLEKGYEVIPSGDGLEALKKYQENKSTIALVITDLGLPSISGLEVCQRIKKINPKEHIVLATGFLDPDMKAEFLKEGIEHFLYKPYDLKKVLRTVREVLDKK